MGRASAKLPSFCLSGVATRIRIRPPAAAAAAATAAAAAAATAEAGVGKKPDSYKQCEKERGPKDYQLLYAMKSICQTKRPEVHVEVCLVEGRDRGPTIVEEAGRRRASLLVVGGPRRRSPALTWRLLVMWALGADFGGGNARIGSSSVADYCVHHAACTALAVRRKGRRGGGYLLTTKRHKDFWLLA
ncbi:uncharacterized protein LOC109718494 [Ananas comosus]|uniref:Uncharacterized protein LOC109718494 n=1 Tax=Ananas comosus TaxID=4615 RepID=A0A6P5G4Z8_ANACO|nr:uncharacterized protein LOC109718494 [Ananas comosus]